MEVDCIKISYKTQKMKDCGRFFAFWYADNHIQHFTYTNISSYGLSPQLTTKF